MNLNKKIKAGVIGLGVGLHQARTLRESGNCELVSICDFDKDKLNAISSEFPLVNKTQNDQDILLNPDINLVCKKGIKHNQLVNQFITFISGTNEN